MQGIWNGCDIRGQLCLVSPSACGFWGLSPPPLRRQVDWALQVREGPAGLGRQGVGGGRVSLCPFSGIPLTPGKPGFLDKRCSLCVLSEALSDLVSTEEIVHWKETSRFFFFSFQKMFYTGVWSDCPVSIKMMNEYDILIFNDSSLHCH